MNIHQKIIKKLLKSKVLSRQDIANLKRQLAGKFKLAPPANNLLLKAYRQLLAQKKIKHSPTLENLLQKRQTRTLSGVAPVALITKPYPCPGECIYCPSEKKMPKSYLANEPAVMRAVLCGFDPFKQVQTRLQALEDNGHPTDKVELIILGGTWSAYPKRYQTFFIKRCFEALNNKVSRTLKQAQKLNEKASARAVGLTVETRPDYVTPQEIKRLRELGVTRVELGVQSLDDAILKYIRRGHNVNDTRQATRLLKEAGFKVMYHIMPGLPGARAAQDIKMFQELFTKADFQPDWLKIYPCVVTRSAKIYEWWQKGRYKPYSNKKLLEVLIKIKTNIPRYVRLTRLIRDIPKESIVAGSKISNLREIVQKEMARRNLRCRCIRCREARKRKTDLKKAQLFMEKYEASGGLEYFLSFESKDRQILYAFLRLRIPLTRCKPEVLSHKLYEILPELKNAALVRELHTYGQLVPLDKSSKAIQHLGFGKRLMQEAEKIAQKEGFKKIAVIAGIGVRQYYRQLGYRQEGTYMVRYF